ncbi:hypothetical protein A0O34_00095 [Chryseobacterium glaciei]|uniref:Uncharacterized protein n=1 Tax=Chryseobacterium glaciei TaxID=1685010 RepID=A0A172XPW8_9FLAO|nr:hypothetical protein [Chryseobacterium glaciei]ANF49053.1 hypothetical protein A0O34_00095 [Chryseobacterium glaciei]
MIEGIKKVEAKDLKIGNYLINLGLIRKIEQDGDYYIITIRIKNEKHVLKFMPGEQLLIMENVIVDDPSEYLTSLRMINLAKDIFKTKRVHIDKKADLKPNIE